MNSQKVLVTGSTGQLGQTFKKIASEYPMFDFTFVSSQELDYTKPSSITNFFSLNKFDYVINCAAYTQVDLAENQKELAEQINNVAVAKLGDVCKKNGTKLIHISTDYVFNGNKNIPYQENDPPAPLGVYGESKLKGEQALLDINPSGVIIRTSWVYSEFGQNFVKTMLKLGKQKETLDVIYDQIGSPTYSTDLAKAILHIINTGKTKDMALYHYANEGVSSWYDFSKAIFEMTNIHCFVNPIETKSYSLPAKRPCYSVLNKQKIKHTFGIKIPYWRDSLKECLNNCKKR